VDQLGATRRLDLLARTHRSERTETSRHQLSLVDMHSPGITVRPLVQINGDSEFNEVFFEDVRVPKKNLVGEINRGWMVAITTLMFERAATGNFYRFERLLPQLYDLAKRSEVQGQPALEDTSVRQQLAQFAIEAQAIKYMNCAASPSTQGSPSRTGRFVREGLSDRTEFANSDFAMELLALTRSWRKARHLRGSRRWSNGCSAPAGTSPRHERDPTWHRW